MKSVAFLLFFIVLDKIKCSRILVMPMQGKSHMIATNAIGQDLKKNGHEVFTIAEDHFRANADKLGAEGLEILYFTVPDGTVYSDSEEMQKNLVQMAITGKTDFRGPTDVLLASCTNMMNDKAFLDKIASLKFDLALVEVVPFLPCSYILPHVMQIPHVSIMPGFYPIGLPGYVGLPSYSPLAMQVPSSMPMSFKDRMISLLSYIIMNKQVLPRFFSWTGVMPALHNVTLLEEYREKGQIADHISLWSDFIDDTQLVVMVNSDLTMDYPKPLFPNVVSVEGLSAKEAKPLSKDIEDLIQSSQHGVIVVSFGSHIKYLPDEVIIKIVNIFRKRNELFLMRYSGSLNGKNFDLPRNVKFMSWLPQNDLLAHKNVKLFITHGGLNGIHEAIYQGVPMLCVPLFGDQPGNAKRLEARGYGLWFSISNYTENELLEKMEKMLSDSSYRENVQRVSKIMKHRPLPPGQTAVFWIEHVLQFGGEHLKPSSISLSWWQFYCLDTLATITLALFLVLWLTYKILKFVFKRTFRVIFPSRHEKRD